MSRIVNLGEFLKAQMRYFWVIFKHCEIVFMNEKYISLHENLFKSEIRMDGDPLIKDIWQIGGHFWNFFEIMQREIATWGIISLDMFLCILSIIIQGQEGVYFSKNDT